MRLFVANKLPWFTHDHDAHEDGWIRNLVRNQGHVAGWLWWVLLELHHNHGVGDSLRRDISDVSRAAMTSNSVVTRVLTEMATEFEGQVKLSWILVGTELRLEIKKFRERQSKLKINTLSKKLKTPIEGEGEGEREREREKTISAVPKHRFPKQSNILIESEGQKRIRRVVEAYKHAKDIDMKDKSWDKANFGRAAKAAKSILDRFSEDTEKCAAYIFLRAEDLREANREWTLETIVRHAWDGMGIPKEKDNGSVQVSVDANSLDGPGRSRRITSSREVISDTLRAIEQSKVRAERTGDLGGPVEDSEFYEDEVS